MSIEEPAPQISEAAKAREIADTWDRIDQIEGETSFQEGGTSFQEELDDLYSKLLDLERGEPRCAVCGEVIQGEPPLNYRIDPTRSYRIEPTGEATTATLHTRCADTEQDRWPLRSGT